MTENVCLAQIEFVSACSCNAFWRAVEGTAWMSHDQEVWEKRLRERNINPRFYLSKVTEHLSGFGISKQLTRSIVPDK